MKERIKKPTTLTALKKPVYMRLPFRGDSAAQVLSDRLITSVHRVFPTVNMRISFHSRALFIPTLKDKLLASTTSMCIYQFTCSCGARYIGRTTRKLSQRIREHLPAWYGKGLNKATNSSILTHLIATNHRIKAEDNFKILYKISHNTSQYIQTRLLNTTEAIAIRLLKPDLCVQKRFVQGLQLPWIPIVRNNLSPSQTFHHIDRHDDHSIT